MLNLRQVMRALSALPLILAAGCFPDGATDPVSKAANMAAKTVPVDGSLVGTSAAPLPSVVVTNNGGKGVSGVAVTFTVTAGNGSITSASVKTDKQGVASTGWTYGMLEGDNILSATLGTLAPVAFRVHTTGGGPKSMSKENDGQSAAVGSALAQPVSVVVLNGGGHPVTGASVLFTALGGSTLTGSAVTATVASDANGRAQSPWTMGTVPGAYSLTAEVTGVPTLTFGATAVAGAPASIVKAGDAQSATVNTKLPNALGIQVLDRYQNAVSGVAVTYAPQNGGSASVASDLTNSTGHSSTEWTLPTVAGAATLYVTAGGLSESFSATANAGAPAKLQKMASSDNQTGNAGQPLTQAMSVTVRDAYDNALPNVSVSFSTQSGSVNPATVATDNVGQANTIWTLGSTGGSATLSASAVGVADPAVFTATVVAPTADPCDSHGTLVLGRSVSGNLANSQCAFPTTGTKVDLWTLDLGAATPVEIVETSADPSGDSYMAIYRGQYAREKLAGFNDDLDPDNGNYNSRIRFLGGAGRVMVGASYLQTFANDPGAAYSLVASRWGGAVTGCEVVFATSGTSSTQFLDNDDCAPNMPKRQHADQVVVVLRAGETVVVTMNSTAFDAKLDIENMNRVVLASDDNSGGGTNARLTYTVPANAPAVDQYVIFATSTGTAGGSYTFAVDVSTPAGLSAPMSATSAATPVYGPGLQRATARKVKTLRTP